MEKLPMCRICLVDNVRMFVVADKNLQEMYEKLTDVPFVTEDNRPMLACFFCYAKLKQCYQFQRKCLEAEDLFAQMLNNYELKPLTNRGPSEFVGGFVKTSIESINIVDYGQTDSGSVEIEVPAVSEKQCDIVEIKVECQSDELELGQLDNSCLDVADIPPQHSEYGSEDDEHLMEFKTEVGEVKEEVEEQQISKKEQGTKNTKRATVAKISKLDTRRTKPEDAITAERTKKEKSDSKVIRTTQKPTSIPGTYFKEIQHTRTQIGEKPKCDVCQRSFSLNSDLTKHIRIHTGEKPYKCDVCQRSFSQKSHLTRHIRIHTGENPYKCHVCQRSFSQKSNLTQHIRIHTGEKFYKCGVCQLSFSVKGNLSKHIQMHTGEKPYKCDVCQRSFRQKGNLTQHMIRIHPDEKPFKCMRL